MKKDYKPEYSFHIYSFMTRLGLTTAELLIYALIYSFRASDYGIYYGSKNSLSLALGISERTVLRAIKSLSEKGLIEKTQVMDKCGLLASSRSDVPEINIKAPLSIKKEKEEKEKEVGERDKKTNWEMISKVIRSSSFFKEDYISLEDFDNFKYKLLSFGRNGYVTLTPEQFIKLSELVPADTLHAYILRLEEEIGMGKRTHSNYKLLKKWIDSLPF